MSINELAPGIVVFSDVITGYDSLISDIEESVDSGVVSWGQAYVVNGEKSVIDTETRNTQIITVSYSENPEENLSSPQASFDTTLSKIFYDSFSVLEKEYCDHYNVTVYKHEVYSILKYGIGQKFDNHIDHHRNYPRTISLVYYMNENYSGGEISFPRFGIKYKPKANELLMFPSNYVYNHSVAEVTEGKRYAVVTWGR
jgi:Rps23 Pro-64 3,4-dihydroxylase Tpa1-like proline 4-hydroxylase